MSKTNFNCPRIRGEGFPKEDCFYRRVNKGFLRSLIFYGKEASNDYNFGSATWFDGRHSICLSFAVTVEKHNVLILSIYRYHSI
jgi:hypothetical protein